VSAEFHAHARAIELFVNQPGQGIYIPLYQRDYSWGTEEVARLFEDMAYGFDRYVDYQDAATFLGTILTVRSTANLTPPPAKNPTNVHQVIDGQQRLITFLVIAVELSRLLKSMIDDIALVWLKDLAESIACRLESCTCFSMGYPAEAEYRLWPRLIRAGDRWGCTSGEAVYQSDIASYLHAANRQVAELQVQDGFLGKAILTVRKKLEECSLGTGDPVQSGHLGPDLSFFDSATCQRMVGVQTSSAEVRPFERAARLTAMGTFILQEISLIAVEAPNEEHALALFEPLNTTGQSLTGLETFKPLLVQAEGGVGLYPRTRSAQAFERALETIDAAKPRDKERQTAELLTPFALAWDGRELSKHLQDQRRFLRHTMTGLPDLETRRQFVESLACMAEFTRDYWRSWAERVLMDRPLERVALAFVCKSGHSIVQGLLGRYHAVRMEATPDEFYGALRAVAAFWALWRSSRSTTDNVDAYYRRLMRQGWPEDGGLVGPFSWLDSGVGRLRDGIPPASDLRLALRTILGEKGRVFSLDTWTEKVSSINVYGGKSLEKFLLLAAHHGSIPDPLSRGLIKRGAPGVNPLLVWEQWSANYTTEHIAPQTRQAEEGYDSAIYEDGLQNTLGNLTLIPAAENASLSNRPWGYKKLMYTVLGERDPSRREELIAQHAEQGIALADETRGLLEKAIHLPFCQAVAEWPAEVWSAEIVRARTKNLAERAWDNLWPWIAD